MSRIDVKMMDSKQLRELRSMIRKELDFRAEIGEELEDGRIKEWVSAAEYSARIQKEKEVKKNDEETGEEVWSWDPFEHFTMDDYDTLEGQWWNPLSGGGYGLVYDWMHSNAFHFDEADSVIYVSHRN